LVLALVASRATGETDLTPSGPLGKITQLTYGVLMPQSAATPTTARSRAAVDRPSVSANWLAWINYYRVNAGSTPVTEDASLTAGIVSHLRYLSGSASFMTGQFASAHTENPAAPLYTAAGDRAARSSDLGGPGVTSDKAAIDLWLAAPFHAFAMMTPRSARQAFSRSSDGRIGLDVISGFNWATPQQSSPIVFPFNGGCINPNNFGGELPDNTEGCAADWRTNRWTGVPVWVMLPVSTASAGAQGELRLGDGTTYSTSNGRLCVQTKESFHSTDPLYGQNGMAQLQQNNGVLLIPKDKLPKGSRVVATVTLRDGSRISWGFYIQTSDADCQSFPVATQPPGTTTTTTTRQITIGSTTSTRAPVGTTTSTRPPATLPPAPRCTDTRGRPGQCIAKTACRGTRVAGRCAGSASIQCCLF